MALRLTGKFRNYHNELFYVEIYDADLGVAATDEFRVINPKLKREGGDGTLFSRIFTSSFTFSMAINTVATQSFLDDLADQNDKRFFVKLKRNYVEAVPPVPLDTWDDAFNGMMLVDEVKIPNEYEPRISLSFVDSLSVIANNDYRPTESTQYAISSYETIAEHLLNIINLTPAIDYQDNPVLSTNIKYYETFHGGTSLDPFDKTRISHGAFTSFDDTQNNYRNTKIKDVLQDILTIFDARIYYDTTEAIYRVVQRHELDSSTLDNYTYTKLGTQSTETNIVNTYTKTSLDGFTPGGFFGYFPPLKKAILNYQYQDKTGLEVPNWDADTASTLTYAGLIKVVSDDTRYVLKGTLSHQSLQLNFGGDWLIHRALFRFTLKFERVSDGSVYYYAKNVNTYDTIYGFVNEADEWTATTLDHWEYASFIIDEQDPFAWINKEINISTLPLSDVYTSGDYLKVYLLLENASNEGNGYDNWYGVEGDTDPTTFIQFDWQFINPESYTTEEPEDNDFLVVNEQYYGLVSEDNSYIREETTSLGDTVSLNTIQRLEVTNGADWQPSLDWATGAATGGNLIQELVILDMIRSQGKNVKRFEATVIGGNMRLGWGLVYDSVTWIPLDGTEDLSTGSVRTNFYAYKDYVISSTLGIDYDEESEYGGGQTSGGGGSATQVLNYITLFSTSFTGSGTTQVVDNLPDPADFTTPDSAIGKFIDVFVGGVYCPYKDTLDPYSYKITASATTLTFGRDITGEYVNVLIREF